MARHPADLVSRRQLRLEAFRRAVFGAPRAPGRLDGWRDVEAAMLSIQIERVARAVARRSPRRP